MKQRRMSIATIGRTIPWNTVIPSAFFAASAISCLDPTKAPAISFLMVGFGMLFFDSVAAYFTKPATEGISKALTDAMLTFSDEENQEQADKLFDALATSVAQAFQNSTLTSTMKRSIIETVSDDELQGAAIQTMQKAMKKAADNEDFKGTLFDIIKGSFVGALSDESFINESMHSAVASMVAASQDEELRDNMLSIITQAVTAALHDEDFIGEFREVVKGCLADGTLYRSGAKGVFNAAFGGSGKKNDDSEKQESSEDSSQRSGPKAMISSAFGSGRKKDDSESSDSGGGGLHISGPKAMVSSAFGGGKKKDDSEKSESSGTKSST